MKLHDTKIRVTSSEQSKQFQEAVLASGGCWSTGEVFVKDTHLPYFYVTATNYMAASDSEDWFKQCPSPDITEEFFDNSIKPKMVVNPKVGYKIYHEKDPQQNLHFILYIGAQLALILNDKGQEIAVDSNFTGWLRHEQFSWLKVDEPVWVRNSPSEEWFTRHYAGNRQVFAFGRTSHTQDVTRQLYSYKYWKHKTLGEWEHNED